MKDTKASVLSHEGTALIDDAAARFTAADGDQLELEERHALQRVAGLSTELTDVTEVEYRQLRLEKVVLVGLFDGRETSALMAEVSLRELAALAETAGSQVLDGLLQRRLTPDPGTYVGSGKAEEIARAVALAGADTVIVDGELGASQRRALEDIVKVKVVDRTVLILDIFAQHAKSREGKAQVELAQLDYLLPRLRGWGDSMSRQAGGRVSAGQGIGSRGPGETKIELDRRRIRQRMSKLRRELAAMTPARAIQRSSRRRNAVPSVAIVGYTNAGKSSLLNNMTGAGVLVENALFATLDPTVRRAKTRDGREFTLTDTVGFVRNLPHQLIEAFRSTLEEAGEADVILHIVDVSHPDPTGQISTVRTVLGQISNLGDIPEILVFNKTDLADDDAIMSMRRDFPQAIFVSAHTGEGIEALVTCLEETLPRPRVEVELTVPYSRGDLVSRVHERGELVKEEYRENGTYLHAMVYPDLAAELESLPQ